MLQTLITSLKTQLSEKEARIAELEGEVASKNLTINDLTDRLGTVSRKSAQQAEIIESQGQLMKEQDATIHEVYVKIASKKQLVQSGLLTKGGLFSKKKVDYENLDRSLFDKEDDRTTTFSIPTKKAKILTQMPEDSYTIEPNGEKCTLTILDPARCWSVSKYLIIQAD